MFLIIRKIYLFLFRTHVNLLLKAKENGLVHRKMPETYLIKEELSEEEKEIKALKQELE